MEVGTNFDALSIWHPNLLWADVCAAVPVVLRLSGRTNPCKMSVDIVDVPIYDDPSLVLVLNPDECDEEYCGRLARTYEATRLVEMAAIALAGVVMFHVAHLEIRDVALTSTGADYLVGNTGLLLEVGGRSRHQDFKVAWEKKWENLTKRQGRGFFLFVIEFETLSGRLAFRA